MKIGDTHRVEIEVRPAERMGDDANADFCDALFVGLEALGAEIVWGDYEVTITRRGFASPLDKYEPPEPPMRAAALVPKLS